MNEDIPKLTANCEFEDCNIIVTNITVTLLGTFMSFDKDGNPKVITDPNTKMVDYQCLSCGKTWKVTSQDENIINISGGNTFLFRSTE